MPGCVVGREPAAEGVTDEMDAAHRQVSQHLVQPVRLIGSVADRPALDAQTRVPQGVKGIGGASATRSERLDAHIGTPDVRPGNRMIGMAVRSADAAPNSYTRTRPKVVSRSKVERGVGSRDIAF